MITLEEFEPRKLVLVKYFKDKGELTHMNAAQSNKIHDLIKKGYVDPILSGDYLVFDNKIFRLLFFNRSDWQSIPLFSMPGIGKIPK